MGFWGFLFGQPAKSSPAEDYVECERYFRPSGEMIGLSATSDSGSLTQRQEDFIAQIEKDYALIVVAIIPGIEEEFRNWMPEFKIGNFEQEFKPVHLDVPTCCQQPIKWEIAFETVHDRNHIFSIAMLGFQPQYVRIDG